MRPFQWVVYSNSEGAVSPTSHEKINREKIVLSKPVAYFSVGIVEHVKNGGNVSTHQRVEKQETKLM